MRYAIIILGFVAALLGVLNRGATQGEPLTLSVICTDPSGCFRLVEPVLQDAPEGAVVQLSGGIFYEKSLRINKSVTLRGVNDEYTEIRLIDPDTATLIVREIDHPIDLTLENLTLRGGITSWGSGLNPLEYDPAPYLSLPTKFNLSYGGTVISINTLKEGEPPMSLTLSKVKLYGQNGIISFGNNNSLQVKDSIISANTTGIYLSGGKVTLSSTLLISEVLTQTKNAVGLEIVGDGEKETQVDVQNSLIGQWPQAGIKIRGIFLDRRLEKASSQTVRANLQNNYLKFNGNGIQLMGNVDADLSGNTLRHNEYGIQLNIFPCVPVDAKEVEAFSGTLQGTGNILDQNKKGDLCPKPEDYPWPQGFSKSDAE